MLQLGILKTWNSTTHKAGVQLVGSLTTYLDDIAVATNIAAEAMIIGNYVLVAIPGGNPRDACIVASWPAGSSGGGGGGSKIQDADGDTYLWVEKTADEDKIHGVVKGVEALLLDDAGVLTLAKQSSAKGYRNRGQSIPNATWTTVQHNAEDYDIQNNFNLTNHRFEVTVSGVYLLISANTIIGMPADSILITRIRVNGNDAGSGRFALPIADNGMANALTVKYLSAGQYIESQIWHNCGTTKNIEGTSRGDYLIVHKLA